MDKNPQVPTVEKKVMEKLGFLTLPTEITRSRRVFAYYLPVACVAIALFLSTVGRSYLSITPFSLFYAAVALAGWYGGLGPALVALVGSIGVISYFILPPYTAFSLGFSDLFNLCIFGIIAFFIVVLIETRRRSTEALREQRELLRVTLASIGDGVIVTDTNEKIVYMNGIAESLTGYSSKEARGRLFTEVFKAINEDTRRPIENIVKKVLFRKAISSFASHVILVDKNSERRIIDDSAAPIFDTTDVIIGVVVVFRDVTEKREEEVRERFLTSVNKKLLSSMDYHETLKSVARLAVPHIADWCAIDVLDEAGRLERLAITHIDSAKVKLARDLQYKFPPDPNAKTGVYHVIKTGKADFYPTITDEMIAQTIKNPEQLRLIRQLGISSAITVPLKVHGKSFGAITFVYAESHKHYDTKDFVFAEELASRAAIIIHNVQLYQQAQKAIASRDQFLSIASHELKTPLTSMILQIQRLLRNIKQQSLATFSFEKMMKMLESVEVQSMRLSQLINDLLNVSLISGGRLELQYEEVDVTTTVRELISRFDEELREKMYKVNITGEKELKILADRLRLEQVIANLVTNAIKYGAGKPIDISIGKKETDAEIIVTDHGIGIPAEQQKSIFNLFERGENAPDNKGFGIGLYIANRIALAHGGKISVESKPNRGSTFILEVPLQPRKS